MKKLSIFMLCCVLLLSSCAGGSQQLSDSGESAESFVRRRTRLAAHGL